MVFLLSFGKLFFCLPISLGCQFKKKNRFSLEEPLKKQEYNLWKVVFNLLYNKQTKKIHKQKKC